MLFNKKDWMFRWYALIGSGSKNLHPTRENRGYGSFDGNINLFRWLLEHRIAPQVTGKRPLERRIRRNEGKKRYAAFSFFPPSFVEVFPNFSKFPRVFLALSRAVGRETKRNSSRPSLSLSLVAFANSARKEPRDLLCGGSIENTCNFAAFRIAVSQSIRPLRLICPVTRLVGCAKFIIPATMEKLRRE